MTMVSHSQNLAPQSPHVSLTTASPCYQGMSAVKWNTGHVLSMWARQHKGGRGSEQARKSPNEGADSMAFDFLESLCHAVLYRQDESIIHTNLPSYATSTDDSGVCKHTYFDEQLIPSDWERVSKQPVRVIGRIKGLSVFWWGLSSGLNTLHRESLPDCPYRYDLSDGYFQPYV